MPNQNEINQVTSEEHRDNVGKIRWSLNSHLAQLQTMRYVFGDSAERQDIALAIAHLEDSLFRLQKIIDNGKC